jgi:aminoglycoside phosphotransferase (APT) family kinase protein
MSWQMPEIGLGSAGLRDKDLAALGIPSADEYTQIYCDRTGREDGIANREFYSAFNFFRLAAILQGIAGRVRDGTAASAHAGEAERAVEPLAALGWSFATRA